MQKDTKTIEEASTSLLTSVFKSEKTIDSQLPVVFKSGYKLEEFNTKCQCCSANLKGNQFKGSIFKVAKNSRFECWSVDKIDNTQGDESNVEKIMIDAVGFCPQCSVYTPCQVHVEDKGLSEEEALAREKMLMEKRKERKHKSFLGLTIQRMDNVKSQRNRAVKTDKKIHDAALNNLGVETGKKIETTKLEQVAKKGVANVLLNSQPSNIKTKEFLKSSTVAKQSLVESRVEKILSRENNDIGKTDNITDINAIARHNLQEATQSGSKAAQAFQVGAMLSQAVIVNPASSYTPNKSVLKENTREVVSEPVQSNQANTKTPKLAFLSRSNINLENAGAPSIASQQLHSVMGHQENNETRSVSLLRSHKNKLESNLLGEELDISKGHLEQEPTFEDIDMLAVTEKPVVRRDSRGVRGSSTSVAAKIEPRKTYVQSSGTFGEKITQVVFGFFGLFSNGYQKLKLKKESRKNDILKGHSHKAEKSHGRESAKNRLDSLRQAKEFERTQVKAKAKKHNHDSFR